MKRTTVLLIIMISITLVMLLAYSAQAQEVIFETRFATVQGSNGLWYIACLAGCDEFFNIAPIDQLYQPQPTDWQAMNEFKRLETAYLGIGFVPLPPPQG